MYMHCDIIIRACKLQDRNMHMKFLFHYRYINRKHPMFWLSKPIWALFSLMKKLSNLSYPKPSLMCYLFDMLIKPIMDYGSEIQNFAITDNNDNLEIIHRKFCKFILGVPTNAINLAVYSELGCAPLSICRKGQVVKY